MFASAKLLYPQYVKATGKFYPVVVDILSNGEYNET